MYLKGFYPIICTISCTAVCVCYPGIDGINIIVVPNDSNETSGLGHQVYKRTRLLLATQESFLCSLYMMTSVFSEKMWSHQGEAPSYKMVVHRIEEGKKVEKKACYSSC